MNTKLQKLLLNAINICICSLISVLSCVQLYAFASDTQNPKAVNVTIKLENATLKQLFFEIENQTEFTFVYDEKVLNTTRKYTFFYPDKNVSEILEDLKSREDLAFRQINNTITVTVISAQQKGIGGVVKDSDGTPLPGATVVVKGTTKGTISDFDGNFHVDVPDGAESVFVSFIGYKTKEVPIGGRTFLEITLEEDVSSLDEVVVTALGIKREEKQLGYAQQTVSSDQLTDARPNNWSEALRGKVPGLSINGLGGPISSQQIKLRGDNSLDPSNNGALIVIDGVVVQNEFPGSGASNGYMGGDASNDTPVDFGNAVSDLNPEDIESISVLKGAGAAALYGYQAANGAIIITTKSGKKQKGLGVTISSNTKFDVITRWPDWQYEYGQGSGKGGYVKPATDENGNPVPYNDRLYYTYGASEDGNSTAGSSSAFGPRFDGQYYYQYDPEVEGQSPERRLWRPYKDNRKAFWRTGVTNTQNISIQGGGEKGSIRSSITHTKNEWIMPNTGFEQLSLSVNANYQVSDRIKLSSVVNYRDKESDNLPGQGYNNHSIAYFMIFQNPNVDLDWYRPIWKEGQEQVDMIRPYSSYIDNPYAMAYEMINTLDQNAVTGNLRMDIELSPKLNLMLRGGLNMYHKRTEQRRPYDINRYKKGYYRKTGIFKKETNLDFLLTYTDTFGENFDISVNAGGNTMDYQYNRQDGWAVGLEIPGTYNLANGSETFTSEFDGYNKANSLYGMMTLGWKDKIYLDLTARNDWNSVLPKNNWSFFYPSASTGIILSEIFRMPEAISFAKLRASVADVGGAGQYGNRYGTRKYYGRSDFGGSAVAPTSLYNIDLKPERTTSMEIGLDLRLFKKRLSLDAAVYQTNSRNQILDIPLPESSGYSSATINAGEVRNQGVELMLNAIPVKSSNWEWNTTLTWSKNESKVLSLHEKIEGGEMQLLSSSGARLMAVKGGPVGALYGRGFERSPDGEVIYDDSGYPVLTEGLIYIGNTQPKWVAGFMNSVRFKNFRLSAVIDGKYGGTIYSHTHHKLTQQGKLKHTLRGREEGELVGKGVVDNGNGTYSPNTKAIPIAEYYDTHYLLANTEANSFDASFIKLREVTVEYNFPAKLLEGTFLNKFSLSLYGRNLAVISDFPIYDPEVAGLAGGTNMHPGVEVGQMPVPTEFGMNIQLGF
ncbi:SusC/RagA family TonB-linked outer membrane protein [Sinomicrobium pectinilyticum]|uniref:SusC/RagA family TonB-linked outer membrane protein n=1 Tax=Sinomicrobium pectinilyticum TaxID=1084421 RepID=A0A3N0DPW0_SINP1|nr:SusC/RagA family TonB-linked outer membrane protein [Sinomicrobium pectinilyticum]RNL77363.1 SusC/RagA family TonB-linked outer membrane protein [Sinomicrobium pectinilyticum]